MDTDPKPNRTSEEIDYEISEIKITIREKEIELLKLQSIKTDEDEYDPSEEIDLLRRDIETFKAQKETLEGEYNNSLLVE